MQLNQYRDYRLYLRDELERRMAKNVGYSLRAFAKHLGVTPQMLSFVLNKKKNISGAMAAQIADRLDLDPSQANYFYDLVALARSKTAASQKIIEARLEHSLKESSPGYRNLEATQFKIISDWHHYAILELTQTKGFRSNSAWIAKRLGIRTFEAEQAIGRLIDLELLEETKGGRLVRTELNLTATYQAPNTALRRLAKQYLEKSIAALEKQSQEERDVTNITMAIDPTRLPQAKKMITEFRRKLCKFLEQGERTEVYVFSPALIKITKKSQET